MNNFGLQKYFDYVTCFIDFTFSRFDGTKKPFARHSRASGCAALRPNQSLVTFKVPLIFFKYLLMCLSLTNLLHHLKKVTAKL